MSPELERGLKEEMARTESLETWKLDREHYELGSQCHRSRIAWGQVILQTIVYKKYQLGLKDLMHDACEHSLKKKIEELQPESSLNFRVCLSHSAFFTGEYTTGDVPKQSLLG